VETADPTGGHIVRGDGNEAVGVFEENAQDIIEEVYRQYLTSLSEEELKKQWYEGIRLAQDECLMKGITSFQDAGSSLEEIERLAGMAEDGKLDIRLWMMLRHTANFLEDKLEDFPKIGLGDHFLTCRAVKIAIDGALGSYGAWLLEPYADKPDFIGQNTSSLKELAALADLCAEHGMQLCTHAIGDRANREVLNAYEAKFSQHRLSHDIRWRIEHAQHLHPEDIPRFGKLGVIAAMQGIHCTSDAPFVVKRLGEDRARYGAYAWRSLLDHGAVVTNGTDAPVEDVDPIASFYATVTRKRIDNGMEFFPEQKLTREEAIYSYTMANAYAAFEEQLKGSLEPGKVADIVILNKDLITCTENEIPETRVLMTIVNGEIKYRDRLF
jgi:predicted amidohydrolase YtcJ